MRYTNPRVVQVRSILERWVLLYSATVLAVVARPWAELESSSSLAVLYRDVFLVDDVKLLRHQRLQFPAIVLQMIQHFGDRCLHVFKRLVPPAQRFRPQELPHPLDQGDVGRVRWDSRQGKLRMPLQPRLDDGTAIILRPIHVQDELLGLRMQ